MVGLGWQQPIVAVQTVVGTHEIPTALAILSFSQTIGGAIFLSVAQTAFSNNLVREPSVRVPDLDPSMVLRWGAANLADHVPKEYLSAVVLAYSNGLKYAFLIGTAMAACSIVGSTFVVEWKTIRGKKIKNEVN